MTALTLTLLIAGGVAAVGDWAAVRVERVRLEYALKPLTLALLIAAASTAHLGATKPLVITALTLGLVGDTALVISSDDGSVDPPFIAGLSAFLVGHIFYIAAFVGIATRGYDVLAGALIVLGVAGLVLRPVLRGATALDGRRLAVVVSIYALVLATMTVLAVGTGIVATAIGAVLFLASDAVLARNQFVGRVRHGDLLVIVSYHLAQFLIVIGLIHGS